MSTPEKKSIIWLSMNIRCWTELASCGASDILRREYGALLRDQAEADFHVTLEIDLEAIPTDKGTVCDFQTLPPLITSSESRDDFIKSISLLKRNALAAPFELAFKEQKSLESSGTGQGQLQAVHYRDEEAIYIQAAHDRVTVIFSTVFREETDRVIGKVFLQVYSRSNRLS
jgi:actin related protein 2/3 complex subunit 2